MSKNIVLIGAMGSGKTSVGKRLACVLKQDFFDTDFEIISRTGVNIEYIFDIEGEAGFRARETKVLSELLNIPNVVIATGGGVVTSSQNLAFLKSAIVIYLSSDVKTLVERCTKSKSRPLINQSVNKEQTIIDILNKREALYKQAADITIDTSNKKLYVVINNIKESLKKYNSL